MAVSLFLLFLQSKGIITKQEVNTFVSQRNMKVVKMDINQNLTGDMLKGNAKKTKVNDFFNELIENGVWLIYCGENEDFKYLPK